MPRSIPLFNTFWFHFFLTAVAGASGLNGVLFGDTSYGVTMLFFVALLCWDQPPWKRYVPPADDMDDDFDEV